MASTLLSTAPPAKAKVMSLKLLIDKTKNKVLFAEANKGFVDFLLHILALPVSAILATTAAAATTFKGNDNGNGNGNGNGNCCCLSNLYHALTNLNRSNNVLPSSEDLLNPRTLPICGTLIPLLLPIGGSRSNATLRSVQQYRCPGLQYVHKCREYVSEDPAANCPQCDSLMDEELITVAVESEWGGYVKDVPFMVMDDFEVKPLSVSSVLTLLKNLDGQIEEKIVEVGLEEGVKLLKAAIQSKGSALTDVFLSTVEERGDGVATRD